MRPLRWFAPLAVALLLLAGCTGDGADMHSSGGVAAPAAGGPGAAEERGEAAREESGVDTAAADVDRDVVTTGSMLLVVDDARAAVDDVVRLVEGSGGRVDERSEQAGTDDVEPSASLVVRIPAAELTATIEDLEALGESRDLRLSAQDVTRTTRDLDARITALEASTERLVAIMGEAQTSEALVAAESSLSQRQADLESLRSERAHLADQVAMSTLRIDLVTHSSPTLAPGGFVGGLTTGWESLVSFASAALVVLGTLLPWLAVLGVAAAVAVPLWRRRRRAGGPAGTAEPQEAAAG
jgi:polyhydroxyalkanoate synthesis regulator phasin